MTPEERLIPVIMPSLAAILSDAEQKKGSPLTEAEVVRIRDAAPCVILRESAVAALEEKRGYRDIDPDNCWQEWQHLRTQLSDGDGASEPGEQGL